ncbi:N-acetyltransferase, partial [Candidatus Parcubacteria bacterium]
MTEPYIESQEGVQIQPGAIVGLKYREGCKPVRVGKNSVIRAGSILYADVEAGAHFQTGHHVMIREHTRIGDHVVVGTNT